MSSTLGKSAGQMSNVFGNASPVRREDAGPVAEVVDPPRVYATRAAPVVVDDDGDDLAAEQPRTSTSVATRSKTSTTATQPRRKTVATPAPAAPRPGLDGRQQHEIATEARRYLAAHSRLLTAAELLAARLASHEPVATPGQLRDIVRSVLAPILDDLPDVLATYVRDE